MNKIYVYYKYIFVFYIKLNKETTLLTRKHGKPALLEKDNQYICTSLTLRTQISFNS